jgi:Zn-dependent protease
MSSEGGVIVPPRRAGSSGSSDGGQAGLMGATVTLGRLAGVEISISWSWLFIFALIVASLAGGVFPSTNEGLGAGTYIAMGVVAAGLFFASLLWHELGHAIRARREGMKISGITLWLLGGVSRFEGMFPGPGAEFRIAIAGPLVTLGIGGGFLLAGEALSLPSAVDGVVVWVGYTNLFLLGFNLLPAFPLDGGRVLHSALWKLRGDLDWATSVAGGFGRTIGALMIGAGILTFLATHRTRRTRAAGAAATSRPAAAAWVTQATSGSRAAGHAGR